MPKVVISFPCGHKMVFRNPIENSFRGLTYKGSRANKIETWCVEEQRIRSIIQCVAAKGAEIIHHDC